MTEREREREREREHNRTVARNVYRLLPVMTAFISILSSEKQSFSGPLVGLDAFYG